MSANAIVQTVDEQAPLYQGNLMATLKDEEERNAMFDVMFAMTSLDEEHRYSSDTVAALYQAAGMYMDYGWSLGAGNCFIVPYGGKPTFVQGLSGWVATGNMHHEKWFPIHEQITDPDLVDYYCKVLRVPKNPDPMMNRVWRTSIVTGFTKFEVLKEGGVELYNLLKSEADWKYAAWTGHRYKSYNNDETVEDILARGDEPDGKAKDRAFKLAARRTWSLVDIAPHTRDNRISHITEQRAAMKRRNFTSSAIVLDPDQIEFDEDSGLDLAPEKPRAKRSSKPVVVVEPSTHEQDVDFNEVEKSKPKPKPKSKTVKVENTIEQRVRSEMVNLNSQGEPCSDKYHNLVIGKLSNVLGVKDSGTGLLIHILGKIVSPSAPISKRLAQYIKKYMVTNRNKMVDGKFTKENEPNPDYSPEIVAAVKAIYASIPESSQ